MAVITRTPATATSLTFAPTSLGSSATLVAGYESSAYDIDAAGAIDVRVTGTITVGTSPTVNTTIEIWAIGTLDHSGTYPDVFDGTASTETVTSRNVLAACGKCIQTITVDNTSDRTYVIDATLGLHYGAILPDTVVFFVVHNTGVNLNSTGGNHTLKVTPLTYTST